jgi:hypothetical protein
LGALAPGGFAAFASNAHFFHRLARPYARCGSLESGDPAATGLFFRSVVLASSCSIFFFEKTTPVFCFCFFVFCFAVPCVIVISDQLQPFS